VLDEPRRGKVRGLQILAEAIPHPNTLHEAPGRTSPLLGAARRQIAWTAAAIAVTVVCLSFVDTGEMAVTLRRLLPRIQLLPLLLVLPLRLAVNQVRSARFALALGVRGPGTAARMGRICALLLLLGYALPFKLGELSFPVLARRTLRTPYATSLGALAYSRVTDLMMVFSLGGFALAALRRPEALALARLALPVAWVASLALVFMPALVHAAHAVGRRLTRAPRLLDLLDHLFQGCHAVASPVRHTAYLAMTLVLWGLQAVSGLLTMRAMGAGGSLLDGLLASAGAAVAFALPVTGVAGVGPAQASWAYALTLDGWQWEAALANAFVAHAALVASAVVIAVAAVLLVDDRQASRQPG
jgi:hypothetical protein